jgi:enoyl-CoA hydratase
MTDTDAVLTRREGAVGLMTLNRPESLNTLDVPMMQAMEAALTRLEDDPEVRVIVVTGVDDRAFMAGGNIKDLSQRRPLTWYDDFGNMVHRVFRRFETCDKPTIAAVNGWALGGGMEFMLTIDIRLLAAEAKIGLPEIKLGLFPGGGGSQRLMRQVSPCQAKMLMFTGDFWDPQHVLQLGLVNQVLPRAELMPAAMQLAARIATMSPLTLKLLKHSMLNGAEMPLDGALAYERALLGVVFDSEDAHEGTSAFIAKRKPKFSGR